MIHTVYSNSYEVLRVCLMNNIEALGVSTGGSGGASLFERAFEKVPVITPNNAVEEDLRRAVADRDGICAGIDFMKLSSWMGFFSKEPMANIVGNEADWMIWDLLRRTGSGSFREGPGRERLRHYLEGRSDEDVWHLARRIAEGFVVYSRLCMAARPLARAREPPVLARTPLPRGLPRHAPPPRRERRL